MLSLNKRSGPRSVLDHKRTSSFFHSLLSVQVFCFFLCSVCFCPSPEFNKVYDRLQVHLVDRGESFYQERMKSLMKELTDKGNK